MRGTVRTVGMIVSLTAGLTCAPGWVLANSDGVEIQDLEAHGFSAPEPTNVQGTVTFKGDLGKVRVLVFPHDGKYVGRHGRDTVMNRVKIRAKEEGAICQADSNPDNVRWGEAAKSGPEL